MFDPSDHLSLDEIDDAIGFRLAEDRTEHLVKCRGCQSTVEWKRMAKLGSLWDEERDWATVTTRALAERAYSRGNGMVYMAGTGARVRLVRMRFELPPIIKFNTKG